MKTVNLVDVISSKAVFSNLDNRMATVISVEGDNVKLDMERIGMRVLPFEKIQRGFTVILDNNTLIKTFILREIKPGTVLDDKKIYDVSVEVFDILRERFKDISCKECYTALKELYSGK